MIRIVEDNERYTIIEFTEACLLRWKGKGRHYPFTRSCLYIYDPRRDMWNTYTVGLGQGERIRFANQRRILDTLLEEERKKICHPSL